MLAIILGAGGQDGYYLSQLLSADGLQVIKVSRTANFLHVNIADWKEVEALIRTNQPLMSRAASGRRPYVNFCT